MAYGVAVLPAAIAGVALHSVDHSVLHLLHNAHMVGKTILGAGTSLVVPIEVNYISWTGFIAVVLPQAPVFEPISARDTARRPGDHTGVQIPALVGTPTDKAGAPLQGDAVEHGVGDNKVADGLQLFAQAVDVEHHHPLVQVNGAFMAENVKGAGGEQLQGQGDLL